MILRIFELLRGKHTLEPLNKVKLHPSRKGATTLTYLASGQDVPGNAVAQSGSW